jgi:gliding motility-associated-like protein
MTITRSIAFICFSFLLLPILSGQAVEQVPDTSGFSPEQLILYNTLAADSTGGEMNIPNVFTPNGDGMNDHFGVITDGTTVYEFTIFERSGTRIFHSLSPRIFWDGKNLAGIDVPEGIYYYVIEESEASEPEKKAGFMHLFR